jgi:tetratricopeptide (TPR) repeat protein
MIEAYKPHASFAALLQWHLEVNGTRPNAQAGKAGKPWDKKDFAGKVSVDIKTVANWLKGRVPDDVTTICRVLFGTDATLESYRYDLIRAQMRNSHRGGVVKDARPNNLPFASLDQLFMGRDEILDTLHADLGAGEASAITGRAVHGTGGVGKTRLAIEYAWRYGAKFSALFFVPAESAQKLESSLAALTHVLKLKQSKAPEQDVQISAVMNWLATTPDWLMIFDNVDDVDARDAVQAMLLNLKRHHKAKGRILITGRWTEFGPTIKAHSLGVLKAEDGAKLLLARTDGKRATAPDDAVIAHVIARDDFDGLALALEQASAYISKYRINFATYRREWQTNREKILGWFDAKAMSYNHDTGLAATFLTSYERLTDEGRLLLNLLSFFAADPVPRSLLDVEVDGLSNPQDALADLFAHSLATPVGEDFQVHRCIQDFVQRQLSKNAEVSNHSLALSWLSPIFSVDAHDVRNWPNLNPLIPHALNLTSGPTEEDDAQTMAFLLDRVGTLFEEKANYRIAEPLRRRTLAISEQNLGDNSFTALCLNNLAALLRRSSRFKEAEPLFRRAISIAELHYGKNHPQPFIYKNNLAMLLQQTARYSEAETLFRSGLEFGELSLGENHPTVATRANNLAALLHATGRQAEAIPLYHRALAIDVSHYGDSHPVVAGRLQNLAVVYRETNQPLQSEELFRRALKIDLASYGHDHPRVAASQDGLASLMLDTNRIVEAENLAQQALETYEKVFGADDPHIAISLITLGKIFNATNRSTAAEIFLNRALIILLRAHGDNHPSVASAAEALALHLIDKGKYGEAEPLARQSIAINEKYYDEYHPKIGNSLNTLFGLLFSTNRLLGAEAPIRRALQISERYFGTDHPEVANRLNNLAALLMKTTRYTEAKPLMRRHLIILLKFGSDIGREHPDMKTAEGNYRELLSKMGHSDAKIMDELKACVLEAKA